MQAARERRIRVVPETNTYEISGRGGRHGRLHLHCQQPGRQCRGETQGILLFLFILKIIICSTPAQVREAHAGQVGVGRRDGGAGVHL